MAQIDFDFYTQLDTDGYFFGSDDGYGILHTDLSSPLTGEGLYCRNWENSKADNHNACVSTTYGDGYFVEIPSGKFVSVRAWVRMTDVTASGQTIGIGVKMNSNPGGFGVATRGYLAFIGKMPSEGYSGEFLNLLVNSGGPFGKSRFESSYAVQSNEWYKIRIDVVDNGTEDSVTLYSGAGATGAETWTSEGTIRAYDPSGAPNFYIPWAEAGAGKVGIFSTGTNNNVGKMVDRFQVIIGDVQN